jgi:predicted ATPase
MPTLGINLWFRGQFAPACEQFEQAITLYQPQQHRAQVLFYGPDLAVFCHSLLAHSLWHLGYPDQALRSTQVALVLAQELAHPFSLALALDYAAMLYQFRQNKTATLALAEQAIAVCMEHGFAYYLAWATMLRGWARAAAKPEAEISQLRQGLADLQATGAALRLPYYLALLAEVSAQAGQIQTGLTTLDEALAVASKNEEHWHEAELYRLKGELLLQAEAENYFQKAITIARRQGAKSLELRAVMSLSRLWQGQGRREEARRMLAEIYGWFSEGFDTADSIQARILLEELV